MPDLPKGVVTHMTVNNCAAAIEFYKKALGAKELMNMPEKDGKRIMHAELEINGGVLYINDDFPDFCGGKSRTPQALGGCPITLHLNVPNCDEAVKRAVAAGGQCTMEPIDAFWGARYGQVTDPFGYVWAFMHPLPTK